MNILIVGAGSIGKVYGYHLHQGGAQVAFFVKEKHRAETEEGLRFYPLNEQHGHNLTSPKVYTQFRVLSHLKDVQHEKWDYVILAMSSPALRAGWLDSFLNVTANATIVSLQPGMEDHAYLKSKISFRHLIEGTIHILSYEAPLPNGYETIPGTAYWAPPGTAAAFSGQKDQVNPLLSAFRKGHFAVKAVDDTRKLNILENPLLTLFVISLERVGWSFQSLKKSAFLKAMCEAMPEAVAIQAKSANAEVPKATKWIKPILINTALVAAKGVVPFDLETYMAVHFTKVWDQMKEHLEQLITYGKENQMSTFKLEKFRALANL